jgi:hypothetical protein
MIRLMIVVAMVLGLLIVARSECSPPDAKPGGDGGVWQAAGIVPLPQPTQAPSLRLSDLAGKTVDVRQLRGRLVMVYFWATW